MRLSNEIWQSKITSINLFRHTFFIANGQDNKLDFLIYPGDILGAALPN